MAKLLRFAGKIDGTVDAEHIALPLTPPEPKEAAPAMAIDQSKACSSCKETKSLWRFPRNASQPGGYAGYCLACHAARRRAHYHRNLTESRARARDAFWSDPERYRGYARTCRDRQFTSPSVGERFLRRMKEIARRKLQHAVRVGLIIRPDACLECGSTDGTIQAHHPDYFDAYTVQWLCSVCHGKRHRKDAA